MADQSKMEELLGRLEQILQRQNVFVREIAELKAEINKLQTSPKTNFPKKVFEEPVPEPEAEPTPGFLAKERVAVPSKVIPKKRWDIEKFIGENLINKIGIIITILGVTIGVKYSVDNDLISPLARIISGYFCGFVLLGFGLKLKKKYTNYSAVLVSGAIAILYFITYAAYSFYGIFPQNFSFGIMLIFTVLTVFTALKYNRQVIAHIGMVGAYAIPFLLGDEAGTAWILYSYIAIINTGILVIALKRYWKNLFYVVFGFTWIIFSAWIGFDSVQNSILSLLFAVIFFFLFYGTFLGYKLIHNEKYNLGDVALLLANAFVFYGIGYYILSRMDNGEQFLGLFTLANAGLHAIVGIFIKPRALADKNLYYLIAGLAIVFITIAVPVQLEAGWVTLLWAGEAALLFWISRTRQAPSYERIAYVIMVLAFVSLLEDWNNHYYLGSPTNGSHIIPIWNTGFLVSILFVIAFGFITYVDRRIPGKSYSLSTGLLNPLVRYVIPAIFLFSLYYAFRIEIDTYWQQRFIASGVDFQSADALDRIRNNNHDLQAFKSIWIINYSLVYLSLLLFFNLRILKNKELGLMTVGFGTIALLVFLTQGLMALSELWRSYVNQPMAEYYITGKFHIWIRYISIIFAVLLAGLIYWFLRRELMNSWIKAGFELFMHLFILIILSSELFLWTDIYDTGNSYKLGLSILWGVYSLLLIGLGIRKNQKHLRIAAIALFGLTLIKLFLYDIADLGTLSKTIVFVSLGVLLLIISFLYNKYKNRIAG